MSERIVSAGDLTRPECPFCFAPFTDAMLDDLAAMSTSCGCCGGVAPDHVDRPVPVDDLCCAACGRAIYLAPNLR